jgi:hypothetical protein
MSHFHLERMDLHCNLQEQACTNWCTVIPQEICEGSLSLNKRSLHFFHRKKRTSFWPAFVSCHHNISGMNISFTGLIHVTGSRLLLDSQAACQPYVCVHARLHSYTIVSSLYVLFVLLMHCCVLIKFVIYGVLKQPSLYVDAVGCFTLFPMFV